MNKITAALEDQPLSDALTAFQAYLSDFADGQRIGASRREHLHDDPASASEMRRRADMLEALAADIARTREATR